MRFFALFLSVIAFLPVVAQQSKIDSLRSLANNSQDSLQIDAMNNLAAEIMYSSPVEAAELSNEAIEKAIALGYAKGLLGGYRVLGITYDLRSDYISAIDAYKKGLPIANRFNDPAQKASLLNVLGVAYYHLSQYEIAMDYLLQSLKISEKLDQPRFMANIYTNIGLIYHDQNELDKALDYYEKAIAYGERAKDDRLIGRVSNNIGIILNTKKLYE